MGQYNMPRFTSCFVIVYTMLLHELRIGVRIFSNEGLLVLYLGYVPELAYGSCCVSDQYEDYKSRTFPDSKIHGAYMGPTWVLSAPDGPHVGPMNLANRVCASDLHGTGTSSWSL